jgi:hypothetical protein
MTDRPTPEQIIMELDTTVHPGSPRAISDFVAHAEVPSIIPALREHGYVIVHPDDVPHATLASAAYSEGWTDCRNHIFGDEQCDHDLLTPEECPVCEAGRSQ